MATFPYTGYPDGTSYFTAPTGTSTVTVNSSSALTTALSNATAGTRILLGAATYSGAFTLSGKAGTTTSGITIEAATTGGAIFAAGSSITVTNSAYVTVKGLSFPFDPTAPVIAFRGTSHHCRATRNLIGPATAAASTSAVSKILVADTCQHIRVDHNELRNLSSNGHGIEVAGSFSVAAPLGGCTYWRIDHNYLHDFTGGSGAEKAAIQCGSPVFSRTVANGVVERNVCARIRTGDRRVISGEMSNLRISGNVLAQCAGGLAQLVGRSALLADNYIIDRQNTSASSIPSAGIRFYDSGHEISYNYVDGVVGGDREGVLLIDSGDQEGSSTVWDAHWRVVNPLVERNVLVGNPEGLRFGNNYSLAPTGATVRDNIVAQTTTGTAITQRIAPVSSTLTNNAYYATPATGGMAQGSDTVWRKDGYGPRLTYLQAADVGITGDAGDSDGTGTLISGSTPTPPVDPGTATTAAEKFGWGAPLASSDEFEYTGAPVSTKWNVYNSEGHDGNGVRSPARVSVANGMMSLTGLAGSANTAGLEHVLNQTYGRWEVRARSYYTGSPTTPGTLSGGYHPVCIIWPDDDPTGATGGTTTGVPVGQTTKMTEGFTGTLSSTLWSAVQTHSYDGSASGYGTGSDYRLKVAYNAGIDHPSVLRTEVRDGDTAVGSHERSEISSFGKSWNDRNGDETWYEFDVRFGDPNWTPSWSGSDDWLIFAQGHQVNDDGSPPVAFAVHNDNKIYIEREPDSDFEFMGPLWTIRPGVWEHFVVHIKWSPNASTGFIQVHINGTEVLPKTFRKTMYTTDNVDPYYWKFGQYRRSSIGGTTVVMHDNIRVSSPPAVTGGTSTPRVDWPYGGEYDFLENGEPGEQAAGAFLHYPSLDGTDHQIDVVDYPVDLREFHNFAFEWTPNGLSGWVDGNAWFTHSGGAAADRKALQAMHRGHLTIQLDAFQPTGLIASTMDIEWVRVYTLTPVAPPASPQTVTAVGIASAQAFGVPFITGAAPARPPGAVDTRLGVNTVLGGSSLGYTVVGGGTTPGVQTVFAQGIGTAAAFGSPAVSVANGPQAIGAIGIASAEVFGRPHITIGGVPKPAPGGVLVPALFAVSGDTLVPLPAWTSIKLSPVRNSAGSLEVTYPAGAPGFTYLHDHVSASPLRACEIRMWLGGSQEGALGGWLVQKSGDDLTPGSEWSFTGHFHEWLLTKAIVAPQPISEANKNGELRFAGATAGLILATLMDQAQSRGALPLVSRDFTATHDSTGAPWANAISSLKLAPKTTVAQVADKLIELGMCEYELTAGRVWRAYNPGGRGADHTTGPTPLTFAHAVNLAEHSRRESSRDAGTAVLVAGAEGFYEWASSPTAQAQLGWRAEVGVDAGQLDSQSAVQAVAPRYLETSSAGTAEYAAAVEFESGAAIPLIDYGVGDWAYTIAGTKRRRLRIAQIELEFGKAGPVTGKAVFNDLITDRLTALYRRLNAISTGDAVVGTSAATPGGAGEDTIPPAAPTGLTVLSNVAYRVPGETLTLALVAVGWAPVTTNAYIDATVAGKSQAARLIADRFASGLPVFEDWTWPGAAPVVGTWNDDLLEEWKSVPSNPGGDDNTFSPAAQAWLDGYAAAHQGGGAIADDVASYRVQWAYLGAALLGGFGTPDPFWQEPPNSPTTQLSLRFGDVEGGRPIGVRVAAIDRAGNQGPWSEVLAVDTAVDDQPPPAPSKPTVAAGFRLIRVTWDGKGSSGEDMLAAAPDILSGGGVEIHVAQGIDFTPDRPAGTGGKADLSLSTTYQATLYDAMTYPVNGLENGVTYFVRFVAVDRNGNASAPSETSDGVTPNKLVTIDYGPDTIDRATIRAAAIGSAEIDLLAVNESHIGSVNASSITSGLVTADMALAGRIATPVSATGNKVEFDSGGIRMYRGSTVVGHWQTADASILVTGTYLSALSGERVNILPDGTFRIYPAAGVNYAQIANNEGAGTGPRINFRGLIGTDGRTGHINLQPTGVGMFLGNPNALGPDDTTMGPNISVGQPGLAAYRAGIHAFEVEQRMGADSSGNRVYWRVRNSSGVGLPGTVVHYSYRTVDNTPRFWGPAQDAGICFAQGEVFAVNVGGDQFRPFRGSAFNVGSARALKTNERSATFADPRTGRHRNLLEVARHPAGRSRRWRYLGTPRPEAPDLGVPDEEGPVEWEFTERPEVDHVGPIADDLLQVAPELVQVNPDDPEDMTINIADLAGAAWAAVGVAGDEIASLAQRLAAVERRLDQM